MLSERVESSRLLPTLSIMIDLLLVFFFHPLQISILEVYHGYNAFILTAGVLIEKEEKKCCQLSGKIMETWLHFDHFVKKVKR